MKELIVGQGYNRLLNSRSAADRPSRRDLYITLCHSFNLKENLLLKTMWLLSWYLVHSCLLFSFGIFYVFTKYNDIRLHTDYVRSGVDTLILQCKLRALRGIPASWPIEAGSFRIQYEMQGMHCLYGNVASVLPGSKHLFPLRCFYRHVIRRLFYASFIL
jgi:hypothetical protein